MAPAVRDGDWLLVDPTIARWPRKGSVVVIREPGGDGLAIKRVAGIPGERVPFEDGFLDLADDEAWLLSDASPAATAAAGHGDPIDSRRYGPVPVASLVGRAWFRYAPWGRIGPISSRGRPSQVPQRPPG